MKVERELTRQRDRFEDPTDAAASVDLDLSAGASTQPAATQLEDNITVLRESWVTLKRRAHYLSQHRIDADDLLASAVAAAWAKWVEGVGPSANIVAYITQSMRNRMIDELRSPRSGEVPLDVGLIRPAHFDDLSDIDHHVENTQLKAALGRLPEGLQRVLIDVVVNGRKPRELEDEYRTTSSAISTAVYRAKKLLRSEIFLEVVRGSCTRPECARPQARVARELGRSGAAGELSMQTAQLRQCRQCASGLNQYFALSDRAVA